MANKFEFGLESFGEVKFGLKDSLILTKEECQSLQDLTESSKEHLLYRATKDGFHGRAFHSKCDGKWNTITIIKNNLNYVFGGFASSAWNSSGNYVNDPNAFIFSLRRAGISFKDKFTVKSAVYALAGISSCGPIFGGGHDIYIRNESNKTTGSHSDFGHSYNLPNEYTYGGNAQSFLAGNFNEWTASEIEVFQIT